VAGDLAAVEVGQQEIEDGFGHEDAFGVVPQRPVTEISGDLLGLVEPGMDGDVILRFTAPFLGAGERVMIRMCHVPLP